MPKTRPAYPAEFRRQMVDLVRAGRDPSDLAREFEPSRQTIQNGGAEADRVEGRREAKPPTADPGLTATERDELVRLRRENRQLKRWRWPSPSASRAT
jgi:transposase